MSAPQSFDAIDLSIMWDRLISITDEGAAALVRTSFSTLVREGFDLSVLIFDLRGRVIAQSAKCIPVFIGTASTTLRHMLDKIPPESLEAGDVVVSNDPVFGTGHMYDIAVMRPIYLKGDLVGYAMSISHLPDIGGMGFSASATEIYHEGLRLPVVKLVKAGVVNQDFMNLIRLNVRVPDQVIGDIHANISCTSVVTRQVVDFMETYGCSSLEPLANAILQQSEDALRQALLAWPDGQHTGEVLVEAGEETRRLVCTVKKQGDRLSIDFTGTEGCVRFGSNVPICYTRSMALYAAKCLTTPMIPNNEGSSALIEVSAPVGCILNAVPPAPSAGRHAIGHFVVPLVFDTVSKILPDQVAADSGLIDFLTLQGHLPDGSGMSVTYCAAGGFGALQGLDGRQTTPGSSNMGTTPIEVFESLSGLRVEEKILRPDSGGVGQYRGGVGQVVSMRNMTGHDVTVHAMSNRTRFPAKGLFGGGNGAPRAHLIDGRETSGQGSFRLPPNSVLTLKQAGGGGYGSPKDRPQDAVRQDIEDGFLTIEQARETYGYDGAV
ncbi:MAG: hypothetical protein CMM62_00610 [Rhodospirillaceae bacterium]|nr:hypothetical protein [Rhodospirillaceae bacterium]MAX62680.1 hypothetical protein [Rhodospirillaceae bacterium]|tara:strand:+ start:92478 stop:94124 length:1647 start_codon:yes stop_codon:yes gene_type:complete